MRTVRLKDLIQWPARTSAFSSFLSAVIVLLAFVAVWKTLDEQGLLDFGGPPRPVAQAISRVTLTATSDNRFYWDERGPFPLEQLPYRLAEWKKTAFKPEVVIAGDATALLGDTLHLLEEVRQQGIQQYKIESAVRSRP